MREASERSGAGLSETSGRSSAGASPPEAQGRPGSGGGLLEAPDGAVTQAELEAWGERIGREVATPVVLALRGELGAGKSVLARAIARGAGVTSHMPSPTFNLVYRYDTLGGVVVYHLDLYRLNDPDEVWELGWEELGVDDQIVLIEWPERAEALLPSDRWDVSIASVGDDVRSVRVWPRGEVRLRLRRGEAGGRAGLTEGGGEAEAEARRGEDG